MGTRVVYEGSSFQIPFYVSSGGRFEKGRYFTTDGTAKAGLDYVKIDVQYAAGIGQSNGLAFFISGQTLRDNIREPDEQFTITEYSIDASGRIYSSETVTVIIRDLTGKTFAPDWNRDGKLTRSEVISEQTLSVMEALNRQYSGLKGGIDEIGDLLNKIKAQQSITKAQLERDIIDIIGPDRALEGLLRAFVPQISKDVVENIGFLAGRGLNLNEIINNGDAIEASLDTLFATAKLLGPLGRAVGTVGEIGLVTWNLNNALNAVSTLRGLETAYNNLSRESAALVKLATDNRETYNSIAVVVEDFLVPQRSPVATSAPDPVLQFSTIAPASVSVGEYRITSAGPSGFQNFVISDSAQHQIAIGSAGNDRLVMRDLSNTVVDLGLGFDVLTFNRNLRDGVLITDFSAGQTTFHTDTQMNVLRGIEAIRFNDGLVRLDVDLNGVAGMAYRLYEAAFNRTPDLPGLSFWINQLDRGVSRLDVAQGFVNSSEFQRLYGTNPSDVSFVTGLYRNILDREPEPAGVSFWVGRLAGNPANRKTVLDGIANSPENVAGLSKIVGQGIFIPNDSLFG